MSGTEASKRLLWTTKMQPTWLIYIVLKPCITYWKVLPQCQGHLLRPCNILLAFKRFKNAPASLNRQLFKSFDHQIDSVSFSFHTKKISPEMSELTGHVCCHGTYTQNHVRKCSKYHNVTDVLRASSEKNLGCNLALNPWWSNSAALHLH